VSAKDQATFAVNLDDGTTSPAEAAANALTKLQAKIDGDTKSLREMKKALRQLKGASNVNGTAVSSLTERIEHQKNAIATARAEHIRLGGAFTKVKPPRFKAKPIEESADALGEMKAKMVAMLGPAALLASVTSLVTGAVVGLGAATVAATAKLLAYGVAQSGARRMEGLRLEALTRLRRAFGRGGAAAGEMQTAIDNVSDRFSTGRGALEGWTARLRRARLSGTELEAALEGAAIRAEVLGESNADGFIGRLLGAKRSGQSIDRLVNDTRARFGQIAEDMSLDWPKQIERLRKNFNRLFDGLSLEPLLRGAKTVLDLFSQTTASGRALKNIFTRTFQPFIDGAEGAMPAVRRFFQGVIFGMLTIEYLSLKAQLALMDIFGDDVFSGLSNFDGAFTAGTAVLMLFAASLATVAMLAGLVVLAIAAVAAPFLLAWKAARVASEGIVSAFEWLETINWGEIGGNIVGGIVGGITGAAGMLTDAVQGLGTSAIGTIRTVLGIRSPSRVFADLGREIPRGFAMGVDGEARAARQAIDRLVDVPRAAGLPVPEAAGISASTLEAAAQASGGAQVHITIGDVVLQSSAVTTQDAAIELKDEFVRLITGAIATSGAVPA
jgi:hypothetical protein